MNFVSLIVTLSLLIIGGIAQAEPTPIAVYVISKDAKFIGDSMGGAGVILRDVKSGKVLAKGTTSGGTGDTDRIMRSSGRSPRLATVDAAHFSASVDLVAPTLVRLEVAGPLAAPFSPVRATAERWLVPGQKLIAGDGWTIELPGLAVKFLGAQSTNVHAGESFDFQATVSLMCGCPITPGGLWDAADYEVEALFYRRNKLTFRTALTFLQAPGSYKGSAMIKDAGRYRVFIAARNRNSGNSGVAAGEVHIAQ
jgi:hypothetical protein